MPPMSKQNISGRSNNRLKYSPAMTAAVGPDSMIRTGNCAAVSTEVTPPLESMMNSRPPKPSLPIRSCSRRKYFSVSGLT